MNSDQSNSWNYHFIVIFPYELRSCRANRTYVVSLARQRWDGFRPMTFLPHSVSSPGGADGLFHHPRMIHLSKI